MQQFVLIPVSVYNNKSLKTQSTTKQELLKYSADRNALYGIDSLKEGKQQKLFPKADSLVDKMWFFPGINLSESQTLILDGVETGVLLLDFVQQLRRKNAEVPDIYFTSLDAARISPNLVLKQNFETIKRGNWVSFKNWTAELRNVEHSRCCCLWILAEFIKG